MEVYLKLGGHSWADSELSSLGKKTTNILRTGDENDYCESLQT